ncbi:hypothetical protein HYFRA_00000379 [Hymenoscyphus fraxineus]|uniref:Pal1-domain-containing protein n=1 Tax=Hymenoscyphus fraxineus TaxID=746836 RepID=A0A9N9L5D6_9HELO|nr:hypothetical protein HYFRA_00000379 [Hymenoscyphus fraxineus]
MSLIQPNQTADSRSSPPALNINLSSNNPFRNRAASPALSPAISNGSQPRSPFDPPPRPVSRNPFLEPSATNVIPPAVGSVERMAPPSEPASRQALTGNAAELFDNLTLDDKSSASRTPARGTRPPHTRSNTEGRPEGRPPPPYSSSRGRGENMPPRHRMTRSQEEALRARKPGAPRPSRPSEELDIFADPQPSTSKSGARRVRRNSDSSVMSKNGRALDSEDEKRRAERRRRERERRHREKDGKESSSKGKKPDRKLDVIDKLDVTSIYGTGLFHHDGPFDACNPHRNRKGSSRAPMQAFPKDSLNNVLGGGGPLNKRPDHATFLGNNDEEAFKDYSTGGPEMIKPNKDVNVHSATTRIEPIHGEETLGLGTSTFLEGAPASRTAMQRRESETAAAPEGGLGRKKSLAQRIKGINGPRREYGSSGRLTSPEGRRSPGVSPGVSKIHESNPFFDEFSKGDDQKKEASVMVVEPERNLRSRAPSNPPRVGFAGIERRQTGEGPSEPKTGGGFLSRVKSLKGGPRKPKNLISAQES